MEQLTLLQDSYPIFDEILDIEEFRRFSINSIPQSKIQKLLNGYAKEFKNVFYKGNLNLLDGRIVAVVGTRNPSRDGIERARKITRVLVEEGYIVMSGLAKGVDTIAHNTTLQLRGKTIAVLGTPLTNIYPAENKRLAKEIESNGLLLSPSLPGETHGKHLFPRRNRLMARLSFATVIIEAGETSGVIHQASECQKQGKKLIFLKPMIEDDKVTWANSFIQHGAFIVGTPSELKEVLKR